MYTLRTRFKKEIISEFLPPNRKSSKVIILCGGMPGIPSKKELMLFLSKKGFWVFSPRYRGSWESGGKFLKKSPHQDILDIIDELPRGFKSIWDKKEYKIISPKIFLIGSSFGGPAILLSSKDARVEKVIAFSPVVDWRTQDKTTEPLDFLRTFTKEAFGEAYRFREKDWNKLRTGKFYNPMASLGEISGNKIFIIQAKDDDIVGWNDAQKFAEKIQCKLILLKKGGHLSTSNLTKPFFWKKVKAFMFEKNLR